MKAADLFNDELRVKRLMKLWKKDKDECLNIIEVALPDVVDYFYNEIFKKSERGNRNKFYNFITAPVTLKALKKLCKDPSDGLPVNALPFMLNDALEHARFQMKDEMSNIKASQKPKEEKEESLKYISESFTELHDNIKTVSIMCAKKYIKKLSKILPKDLATELAIGLMPAEYVTEENIFKYLRTAFKTIYRVQEMGATETKDGVTSRAQLEDFRVIHKIMRETMLSKATPEIVAEVIIHASLDPKDKFYSQTLTKAQRMAYDAITFYVLEVLDDKIFDKESRYKIIKHIARRRIESKKGGYDTERRIMFSKVAEYVDENGDLMFPRIVKAWDKYSEEK